VTKVFFVSAWVDWSLSTFSVGYFQDLFTVQFCDTRRKEEQETFVFFMDFVEECSGTLTLV
jgi:hypothetical protein